MIRIRYERSDIHWLIDAIVVEWSRTRREAKRMRFLPWWRRPVETVRMRQDAALDRCVRAVRELSEAKAALLASGFRCAEHPPVGRNPDTSCALYPACMSPTLR